MAFKYIEDIFVNFYDAASHLIKGQDSIASESFYNIVVTGKDLTQPQSRYLLKILEKYKLNALHIGIDYSDDLASPVWKRSFRTVDLTRRIYVEVDDAGNRVVCLKHPYQYKELFEKEVLKKSKNESSVWDADQKLRKYSIYDLNPVLLNEFVLRHKFEIDNSFTQCLVDIEQIWQDFEAILPCANIVDGNVTLNNASPSAAEYFRLHSGQGLYNDILLSKDLGIPLKTPSTEIVEQIGSHKTNQFWISETSKFFEIYKKVNGPICLLVSEDSNLQTWLESFIAIAKDNGIDDKEIKICFRSKNSENPKFNLWVKENGYGGDISTAKLLIFKNKPAKWLFKDPTNVKIIVINKPFPPSSALAQAWIDSHSCVLYLGDVKPSTQRNNNIVEL